MKYAKSKNFPTVCPKNTKFFLNRICAFELMPSNFLFLLHYCSLKMKKCSNKVASSFWKHKQQHRKALIKQIVGCSAYGSPLQKILCGLLPRKMIHPVIFPRRSPFLILSFLLFHNLIPARSIFSRCKSSPDFTSPFPSSQQ